MPERARDNQRKPERAPERARERQREPERARERHREPESQRLSLQNLFQHIFHVKIPDNKEKHHESDVVELAVNWDQGGWVLKPQR